MIYCGQSEERSHDTNESPVQHQENALLSCRRGHNVILGQFSIHEPRFSFCSKIDLDAKKVLKKYLKHISQTYIHKLSCSLLSLRTDNCIMHL